MTGASVDDNDEYDNDVPAQTWNADLNNNENFFLDHDIFGPKKGWKTANKNSPGS